MSRRFGGAGIRRGLRAPGRSAAADWRAGLEDTFEIYRLGAGNQYATTVEGAVDSLTGSANGHILTAPSTGQRPVISGKGMVFAAANARALIGDTAGAFAQGVTNFSISTRASFPSGGTTMVAVATTADLHQRLHFITGSNLHITFRQSGVGTNAVSDPVAMTPGNTYTFGVVYRGNIIEIWRNGVYVAQVASGINLGTPVAFALGCLPTPTASQFFNGTIYESIISSVPQDAAYMTYVHTQLAEEYP